MAIYDMGQRITRPGLYMRIGNRGYKPANEMLAAPEAGDEPDATDTMLLKDCSGVLLKTSDGYYLAVKN